MQGPYLRQASDTSRTRVGKSSLNPAPRPTPRRGLTRGTRLASLDPARPGGGCMAISGKGVRPPTLEDIPSVTTLPGARLAGLRPPPVHILVIEDHDDTRDVLDMLLRTEGYEVTLAVDGQDGLEKYRRRPPDIVLVDIFMPRKNGIDTIRELTRDFPDSVCIAMSADGDSMRRNAQALHLVGAEARREAVALDLRPHGLRVEVHDGAGRSGQRPRGRAIHNDGRLGHFRDATRARRRRAGRARRTSAPRRRPRRAVRRRARRGRSACRRRGRPRRRR